ncbi:hypothetical protein [Tropicimonas sp. IMCC6043]|uniref:hypothetical protein n=1 Tax=Tropicimonas sp. IMCC6043 TaxID=2510645 RepID=UPI00101BC8C3|nr:hypothetical protein [Tropicimonas sp. IMCC6043]RYH10950.1 hypothetical protein EU800_06795 [Tropicimonas sp. IMCC6043]
MQSGKLDTWRAERRLRNRWFEVVSPEGELPLRIENKASTSDSVIRGVAAGACFVAAWMIAGDSFGIEFGTYERLRPILPMLAVVAGLWQLAKAVKPRLESGHIEITRDKVTVVEPRLFGRKSWSEPLSSFAGVRWSKRILNRRNNSGGNRDYLHIIDLAHPDDRIFVPLDKWITAGDEPRKLWEQFSALLDLPAIDARDDDVQVRAAGDVDKNIRELARDGKVSTEWDDRPPPQGIGVSHVGGTEQAQEIHLEMFEQPISPMLARVIGGGLVAAALFGVFQGQIFVALLCLGFAYLLFRVMKRSRTHPTELRITREQLSYVVAGAVQETVMLGDVERVKAGTGSVVLETDEGEKIIARNLPPDGLAYVRDIVESAIANA